MTESTSPFSRPDVPQGYSLTSSLTYQWDVGTLAWVKGTQPGGGAGGAVTIADGADVAEGSTADAAWVSGAGTVISLLKKIASAGGSAVSIADGADVAEGATADAAVVTDVAGTISGKMRGLVKWAFERMPASLGQKAMAASLPVVIASDQTAVPISGAVTNTVLSVVGGGTEAAAQRVTIANNSTGLLPISAASLPLPTNASTSALQTQPGVDIGDVTINNAAGASAVNIQDGGNSITVDGTVTANTGLTQPLTDTQLRASAVPISIGVVDLAPSAPTAASVGVASAQALAANASRKGLVMVNTSSARISFGFGSAAVLDSGITLYPGGVFEMDAFMFDLGAVNAIASAAASNLAIQEYA